MWANGIRLMSLSSRTLANPNTLHALHSAGRIAVTGGRAASLLPPPSSLLASSAASASSPASVLVRGRATLSSLSGITHINGAINNISFDHPERQLPGSVVPPSIDLLMRYNVSVPPHLLINDLPWDELFSHPLIRSNSTLLEQITQQHKQLHTWDSCGRHVDPKLAKAIVEKVGAWMGLAELSQTLRATLAGKSAISEVLERTSSTWDRMEMKLQKIQSYIESGKWDQAKVLAERGVLACDRLFDGLDAAYRNVQALCEEKRGVVRSCLTVGAGFVVAGVAGSYLGLVSDAVPADTVSALQGLALTGAVVLFGVSAFNWLHSSEARDYLQRIEAARMKRVVMRNRFEEALDDVLFGNPDVIAEARTA